MPPKFSHRPTRTLACGIAALALAACDGPVDLDLRDLGDGFDTTDAVQTLAERPAPDSRGVISYPGYQVAVARRGDTAASIAGRLGLDADTLARFNGIEANVPLRQGEIVALPVRVSESSGASGNGGLAPAQVDVTALASAAIDRAGPGQTAAPSVQATPLASPAAPAAPAAPRPEQEPIRHKVERGETAYSVARLYDVPVRDLAEWNGLGPDLTIRQGQFLLIPLADGSAPPAPVRTVAAPVEAPGQGSVAPVPPSAAKPLPEEPVATAPAATASAGTSAASSAASAAPTPPSPNLGAERTEEPDARFVRPVNGPVVRAYSKGRNEGIDIGSSSGAPVKAADDGVVAAVTKDTNGIAILVVKHADNLLTVYTNIDALSVGKGDAVSRGQTIAKVRAADPAYLHFEVRRGLESIDPSPFLE